MVHPGAPRETDVTVPNQVRVYTLRYSGCHYTSSPVPSFFDLPLSSPLLLPPYSLHLTVSLSLSVSVCTNDFCSDPDPFFVTMFDIK